MLFNFLITAEQQGKAEEMAIEYLEGRKWENVKAQTINGNRYITMYREGTKHSAIARIRLFMSGAYKQIEDDEKQEMINIATERNILRRFVIEIETNGKLEPINCSGFDV